MAEPSMTTTQALALSTTQPLGSRSGKGGGECVKVVVRVRPLFGKEINEGREKIVEMDPKRGVAILRKPGGTEKDCKDFTYDAVFDERFTQQQIFEDTALEIVDSVMDGFNGTIFAYGQTGAGKSHTMTGPTNASPELQGLLPRCFTHIFSQIDTMSQSTKYLVRGSYLEIYNEEIRDLLSKNPKERCDLKDGTSGVYVKDLSAVVVKSVEEMNDVLARGLANRSVAATNMNEGSSRSHSIFMITVEQCQVSGDGEGHIRVGKLNMVDLAGSERQSKTGATGERLKEATKINLSLSALGNVISALVDGRSAHIPYRDSKLTRLLQDSLGGNTKTVMVANLGPADYNYDETLSTLRYAYRAKSIKNKPVINEDPKDAMIREFQEEIMRLKAEIMKSGSGEGPDAAGEAEAEEEEDEEEEEEEEAESQPRKGKGKGKGKGKAKGKAEEPKETSSKGKGKGKGKAEGATSEAKGKSKDSGGGRSSKGGKGSKSNSFDVWEEAYPVSKGGSKGGKKGRDKSSAWDDWDDAYGYGYSSYGYNKASGGKGGKKGGGKGKSSSWDDWGEAPYYDSYGYTSGGGGSSKGKGKGGKGKGKGKGASWF